MNPLQATLQLCVRCGVGVIRFQKFMGTPVRRIWNSVVMASLLLLMEKRIP